MIAAQAILEGAILINADPAFDGVEGLGRRW
jgi:predicted nucleic acid-binding protein